MSKMMTAEERSEAFCILPMVPSAFEGVLPRDMKHSWRIAGQLYFTTASIG